MQRVNKIIFLLSQHRLYRNAGIPRFFSVPFSTRHGLMVFVAFQRLKTNQREIATDKFQMSPTVICSLSVSTAHLCALPDVCGDHLILLTLQKSEKCHMLRTRGRRSLKLAHLYRVLCIFTRNLKKKNYS